MVARKLKISMFNFGSTYKPYYVFNLTRYRKGSRKMMEGLTEFENYDCYQQQKKKDKKKIPQICIERPFDEDWTTFANPVFSTKNLIIKTASETPLCLWNMMKNI